MQTAQAKKAFHDWLDAKRPWANHTSMYVAMEEIVAAAALYFADERIFREAQWNERGQQMLSLTESMAYHPDGYDGPCCCEMCLDNL